MKKYYYTLTKEKKKEIKEIYNKEDMHSNLKIRLNRLKFYAIIGYSFAALILFYAINYENNKFSSIFTAITLIIIATIYIIGIYSIKLKVLNKIALEHK